MTTWFSRAAGAALARSWPLAGAGDPRRKTDVEPFARAKNLLAEEYNSLFQASLRWRENPR